MDAGEEFKVADSQRCLGACSAVVVPVGLLDAVLNQEAQCVRRQVERQDEEVEQVVVVEKVDA